MSANTVISPGSTPAVTSPELVLVDAALARRARDELAAPADTLARLEQDIWRRRLAALEGANAPPPPATRRARVPRRAVAASGIAAGLAAALLLGVNVNLRGDPAGADPNDPGLQAAKPIRPVQPSTTTRAANPAPTPRASARTFAWAPSPDASGYHVEFFLGAKRVLARQVADARLTLPATWSEGGRKRRLEPGTYRWYVWPIVDGLRSSQAVVQADLVLP